MFELLSAQPSDPLTSLIGLVDGDTRSRKTDLGLGVYRDEDGRTPIMSAVKAAEIRLQDTQDTKSYIGVRGDTDFLDALWTLVGGASPPGQFKASMQTPGGSSALRIAADLIRRAGEGRVLIGTPGWANHLGVFAAAGVPVETYPCFQVETQTFFVDRTIAAVEHARAGDIVLLQAGCHNPTGATLSIEEWNAIATVLERRGIVPIIDVAYQGLGRGIEADVIGLRLLVSRLPEVYIAVSASKTFGLYRERVGAIYATLPSRHAAQMVADNFAAIARVSYSMPPAHGAAIVRTILTDEILRRRWTTELDGMRARLLAIRYALAERLSRRWPSMATIAKYEGLFCLLPLDEAEVLALRSAHAIYMPSSGRINLSGLSSANFDRVVGLLVEP